MNAVSDSGLDTNQLQTQMEGKFYNCKLLVNIYNLFFYKELI